ncbi:hypothetical protein [Streptomyces sp. NPDC003480]
MIAMVTFDFGTDGRITASHKVADPDNLQAGAGGTVHDVAGQRRR